MPYSSTNRLRFIHSAVEGCLGFVGFVFAIADNAAMNIVYLGGTLLVHVVWKSSFYKIMQLFCVAVPIYTLPALCELPFFHIFSNIS